MAGRAITQPVCAFRTLRASWLALVPVVARWAVRCAISPPSNSHSRYRGRLLSPTPPLHPPAPNSHRLRPTPSSPSSAALPPHDSHTRLAPASVHPTRSSPLHTASRFPPFSTRLDSQLVCPRPSSPRTPFARTASHPSTGCSPSRPSPPPRPGATRPPLSLSSPSSSPSSRSSSPPPPSQQPATPVPSSRSSAAPRRKSDPSARSNASASGGTSAVSRTVDETPRSPT